MSTNVETPSNAMDSVKWLVAIALLAGAVVGNYMYADQSVLLRAIGVVVAVAAGLGIAATTEKGRTFLAFAKEARIEVRKVVWAYAPRNYPYDIYCNGCNCDYGTYPLGIRWHIIPRSRLFNWIGDLIPCRMRTTKRNYVGT